MINALTECNVHFMYSLQFLPACYYIIPFELIFQSAIFCNYCSTNTIHNSPYGLPHIAKMRMEEVKSTLCSINVQNTVLLYFGEESKAIKQDVCCTLLLCRLKKSRELRVNSTQSAGSEIVLGFLDQYNGMPVS